MSTNGHVTTLPPVDKVVQAVEDAILRLMQGAEVKAADIKVAVDYLKIKLEHGGDKARMGSGFDKEGDHD